jgi:nicotinamide riboside kinase
MTSSPPLPPNIYIIGAQSTGKTTLVGAIQDILLESPPFPVYPPSIISEIARTVLAVHKFETHEIRDSPRRCFELQSLILRAQYRAEEAVAPSGWTLSDRSAVDPIVYAKQLVGDEASDKLRQSTEWVVLKERMRKSLVVVCEAGVHWLEDDGTRLMPKDEAEWMKFHRTFCQVLEQAHIPYIVVSRSLLDLTERARFVLKNWAELHQEERTEL